MSILYSDLLQNLKKADFSNLSYNITILDGDNTYIGEPAFLSFLFFHHTCQLKIEHNTLQVFPGNVVLLRSLEQYQINFLTTPLDTLPESRHLSANKTKNMPTILLKFDKDLFDTHQLSMLSDCPIFYDLLRLTNRTSEYLFFDCNELNLIQDYARVLQYECSFADEMNEKSVKNALILFMTRLHRIHYHHLIISESSMMPDYTIGSFLKYMTEHYNDVTLVSMAEHFNFHPSYLSSLFKTLSGFTFSEKLLMIRLEHAKRLLVTTNLNIDAIVEMIGFKEKSYFHKCFKRYYNTTPSRYRKENSHL